MTLKPCPFCGSSDLADETAYVRCRTCAAKGPYLYCVERDTAKQWNDRTDSIGVDTLPQICNSAGRRNETNMKERIKPRTPSHFTVAKEFTFEAAHSLPHLPKDHKCRQQHGHSYVVTVECSGPLHPKFGWVVDYAEIKRVVQPIIDWLDHRDLNGILPVPTTAENLARWIADQIKNSLPGLSAVTVSETRGTSTVYRP